MANGAGLDREPVYSTAFEASDRHRACPDGSRASALPFNVVQKRGNHPDKETVALIV